MRRTTVWLLVVLAAYSLALGAVELTTSYDNARNYFGDIVGPVPLYGLNTSFSAALLWGTAVLFGVACLCAGRIRQWEGLQWFYASQVLLFLYLAVDERFKLHETIGYVLGVPDATVLLGIGVLELVLLAAGGVLKRGSPVRPWFLAAGFLFAVMLAIDLFLPRRLPLRLSAEDLAKVWADACLFFAAFTIVRGHIDRLKRDATRPVPDVGEAEPQSAGVKRVSGVGVRVSGEGFRVSGVK